MAWKLTRKGPPIAEVTEGPVPHPPASASCSPSMRARAGAKERRWMAQGAVLGEGALVGD
ncbi:MAG: hypothetical protein WEE64_11970 [Dehalococcoidia bacterium]